MAMAYLKLWTEICFYYADDSCLMFQHKEVDETQKVLSNDSENICDWFVENKFKYSFRWQ